MDPILLPASFALGAVIASFAGVVAERLHTGESWLKGRSRCNSCDVPLRALDLVPVLSWLFSLGRCTSCKALVPWAYPAFEAVVGAFFAAAYAALGLTLPLVTFLAFLAVTAFVVLYDLRHTIVPPLASGILIALGLLHACITAVNGGALGATLVTAGVIALLFLALHVFSRGRAMGLADAPVALALSLIAAPYAVAGLLFSFWIGALSGIAILLGRPGGPRMGIEVPFVPYLALGFLLAYFVQWNPFSF